MKFEKVKYEGESNECLKRTKEIKTLLCAAVGTARHRRGLEACTVCGDTTVCSCRHSKSLAWVGSMYCVWRHYCVQL